LNGGSESTKVFFSLQNFEQEGIGLSSDLNRSSGRLNLDHNINDKMRFSLTSMLGNTKSSRIESENSISLANSFAAVYLANPYDEPYDSDGNIITGGGLTGPNALDRLMTSTNDKDELKGVGSLSLEYDIIEGLTFKTVGGIDYRNTTYERWIDPDSYAGGQVTNGEQGSIAETYRKFTEVNWSNTFDYTKEISDVHLFTVLVGSEYLKRDYIGWNFTGYGLNNKLPGTPAAITPGTADNNFIPGVGGFKTARSLFSLFSTLNYTYNSKYNLFASLRRDGSSAFGANNRYATLYSLGLTWHMSEESFMANMNWINNLKFRVSYGTTGNQEGIANFESLTTYGTTSYGGVPGISLARAGDPNIKWEIGEKFNMGIDYNIFNNRVSGNIDVYNDITSDLFITQTLSAVNGVPGNSKDVNAGRMRNRGIEFLVNADVVRTQDFVWSVGANISYNQNEILSLGQEDEFEVGTSIIRVGLPYGSHYIVKWAGVDPSTGNPLYYTKDGEVTETYAGSDAVADFGTDETPMFGGFNTKVSYKGFEVSAFFTFANDYKRFNNQTFFQENANFTQFNLLKIMETVWQKPGDITEIQRLGTERQFSSKDIEDASFLRFRNLLVAYNLPQKLLKRTNFFKNVRIYGQGQNLFVWTKFTGFDPEDDNNIAGYEYPSARTFTFGVDVSF
jgi:TonB-linked SusC/RagA family outer membrane protein